MQWSDTACSNTHHIDDHHEDHDCHPCGGGGGGCDSDVCGLDHMLVISALVIEFFNVKNLLFLGATSCHHHALLQQEVLQQKSILRNSGKHFKNARITWTGALPLMHTQYARLMLRHSNWTELHGIGLTLGSGDSVTPSNNFGGWIWWVFVPFVQMIHGSTPNMCKSCPITSMILSVVPSYYHPSFITRIVFQIIQMNLSWTFFKMTKNTSNRQDIMSKTCGVYWVLCLPHIWLRSQKIILAMVIIIIGIPMSQMPKWETISGLCQWHRFNNLHHWHGGISNGCPAICSTETSRSIAIILVNALAHRSQGCYFNMSGSGWPPLKKFVLNDCIINAFTSM